MRINKFLASAGIGSRRAMDKLISEGKVSVNGKAVGLGYQVSDEDKVMVEGKEVVRSEGFEYWLVNKPRGVLSSSSDDQGRDVAVGMVKSDKRLFIVGRLDQDSEGMLILTNDGGWAVRVMHPRYSVVKEYEVLVDGNIGAMEMKRLRQGVRVGGERLKPKKIEREGTVGGKIRLRIWLAEGKKREIRRMIGTVGGDVVMLKRVAIGGLRLGDLKTGESVKLEKEEVKKVLNRDLVDLSD